jgi:hypothetical protein
MNNHQNNLVRDFGVIALSILVAVILAKTGILESILVSTKETQFVGSFIAGIFFVSVFTVAPATVALGEIARTNSAITVAIIGGLGALIGDLIIFNFVRDRIGQHFSYLVKISKVERFVSIFRLKLFRWIIPFIGALIVASPLPDEVGVAMMGLSKMTKKAVIPISFILNALGILAIGLIAKSL